MLQRKKHLMCQESKKATKGQSTPTIHRQKATKSRGTRTKGKSTTRNRETERESRRQTHLKHGGNTRANNGSKAATDRRQHTNVKRKASQKRREQRARTRQQHDRTCIPEHTALRPTGQTHTKAHTTPRTSRPTEVRSHVMERMAIIHISIEVESDHGAQSKSPTGRHDRTQTVVSGLQRRAHGEKAKSHSQSAENRLQGKRPLGMCSKDRKNLNGPEKS